MKCVHDEPKSWFFLTVGPSAGFERTEYRARKESGHILLQKRIQETWKECALASQPDAVQQLYRGILSPHTQRAAAE